MKTEDADLDQPHIWASHSFPQMYVAHSGLHGTGNALPPSPAHGCSAGGSAGSCLSAFFPVFWLLGLRVFTSWLTFCRNPDLSWEGSQHPRQRNCENKSNLALKTAMLTQYHRPDCSLIWARIFDIDIFGISF